MASVVVWPAKSLARIRKLLPPMVFPPVPVQLLPASESETVTVAPLLFVQLTETDATSTSSVTYTVQMLIAEFEMGQLAVQRMMSGASPPRVAFTVTVTELLGPVMLTVAE